ncbi:MAG: prolyl oligopeptidase family serine peptidase [Firmicutes bacterium]|nr:prolyl oligopeptidase family serine peptidase [Bacillota bacterium]
MTDYSVIDRPSLLQYLFYPRPDFREGPVNSFDLYPRMHDGVKGSVRFYMADKASPTMLYFHGNGEVVSDYDELSPFFNMAGVNLAVADYRGYGASEGVPTFNDLVSDAADIFECVRAEQSKRGMPPGLWVMGRSMGSISALEIGARFPDLIKGLIIESGFLSPVRLIKSFGLSTPGLDIDQVERDDREKARSIRCPVLILHGEYDSLVPLREAEHLYENLGSPDKRMLVIPGADHNDIMFVGLEQYFNAIQRFIKETA